MKLKYLIISLLCTGFFSCTEDEIAEGAKNSAANPGDEIHFSIKHKETGCHDLDHPGTTRTHYGSYNGTNLYPLYWDRNDQISIYCPQALPTNQGVDKGKRVDYLIDLGATQGDTQTGSLAKINPNDAGLQWGNGPDVHDFFAFYPTSKFADITSATTIKSNLPTLQKPIKIIKKDKGVMLPSGNGAQFNGIAYFAEPDMTDCFMYAHGQGYRSQNSAIELNFKPLVTTIEVVIKGPKAGSEPLKVSQVVIRSQRDMVGSFNLTIADKNDPKDGTVSVINDGTLSNTLTIPTLFNPKDGSTTGNNLEPVTLNPGEILVVRGFVLPVEYQPKDKIGVTVHMQGKGSRTKVLDRATTVTPRTINIMEMPKLLASENNYWMTMLDPNVYFSQLSIPGSHNSYNFTTDPSLLGNANDNTTVSSYYQAKDIAGQLKAGARAFSFQVGFSDSQYSQATSNRGWENSNGGYPLYVYAGSEQTSNKLEDVLNMFEQELTNLNKAYITEFPGAQQYNRHPQEFIVLNVTYTQRCAGDQREQEVQRWLKELDETMKRLRNQANFTNKINDQTTISDLKGKVIVFVNYQGTNWPNHTHDKLISIFPPQYTTFTYNYKVATQATNYIVLKDTYHENGNAIADFATRNDRDYDFVFYQPIHGNGIENSGVKLWRQNLERIGNDQNPANTSNYNARIQSKQNHIKTLFVKAVENNKNAVNVGNWYINNIGCFMVVDNDKSYNPNLGEGGNTIRAAQVMNHYTYNYLSNPVNNSAPCGVVLMNYFGENMVSGVNVYGEALQQIIIDNNYRFALKVKPSTTPAP